MKNFEVAEQATEDGATITITAKGGLVFEDGSTVATVVAKSDYGPRLGERVMVGRTLVKVAKRRYDDDHNLMLMDEDTKAWHRWS